MAWAPKNFNSRGGGGASTEVVPFLVVDYKLHGQGKPHVDDYVVARLMRSACGIEATFDDASNPLTEVHVYLEPAAAPPPGKKSNKTRPEIMDKKKGKPPIGKIVEQMGIMTLDGAKVDAKRGSNALVGRWLNTLSTKYNPDLHFPWMGKLIAVQPEVRPDPTKDEQFEPYQSTIVYANDQAVPFTDLESFKAAAVQAIMDCGTEAESALPGRVGFTMRAVGRDEAGVLGAAESHWHSSWNKEQQRTLSPEEMVEAFLASSGGSGWAEAIAGGGADHFEVMPSARLSTGSASLPTTRAENAAKEEQEVTKQMIEAEDDAHKICRYPVTRAKQDGTEYQSHAFGSIIGDIYAERKAMDEPRDDGRQTASWYRTYAGRAGKSSERRIYGKGEFPSNALPPEYSEEFEKRGEANYKAQAALVNAEFEARKAPAAAAAAEEPAASGPGAGMR